MSRARPPIPLPDPALADGEVVLRPWQPLDAPVLAEAWQDPDIQAWTAVPERHDVASARRWIEGDGDRRARGLSLDLAIEVDDQVVGEIGVAASDPAPRTAEIGWWIASDHRGRGLATRATRIFAEWVLAELSIDALRARIEPGNPVSRSVAAGAGFVRTAALPTGAEVWERRADAPT